ncbi:MAG TPA: sodium/glutamate symporter [Burkholderiales bacterium]|nr:sodium/glutamate symporter [Burkholderiales bacterium]
MSLDPLVSLLVAVTVLLIGTLVNRRVGVLSKYNIPDPITGGLIFAAVASTAWAATDFTVTIDQTVKPVFLLMFFAGVGMCADLRMLKQGGKALALFLVILLPFIVVQNAVGVSVAKLLDLHPIFGLVGGSITLVGGHGTGAAYAERFAEVNNLQAVMELSMTVATIGLILGGIVAGPVAQYLIDRHNLRSRAAGDTITTDRAEQAMPISTVGMIGTLAGIFAAVVAGRWLAAKFSGGAITIPAFLWCMILGVAIRNLAPFARIRLDDRASDLVSGVCLSLFLVMTMMALNLVEVALSAGPFLVIIAAQVAAIAAYAIFVCFRFMGRDYEAAVTSAAFIGFNMGSTATAMANMQAIVNKYGPAPQSYLIVPLAGAFFIDIMNAFLLTAMLALPFIGG